MTETSYNNNSLSVLDFHNGQVLVQCTSIFWISRRRKNHNFSGSNRWICKVEKETENTIVSLFSHTWNENHLHFDLHHAWNLYIHLEKMETRTHTHTTNWIKSSGVCIFNIHCRISLRSFSPSLIDTKYNAHNVLRPFLLYMPHLSYHECYIQSFYVTMNA